ncbi:hypothetical protein ABZV14_17385 [Streptosporangium canum]|uniref:hypothetical protein n=1 Tax=Streptosporangium canum TaxID=324952 RepID=UPI0033B05138
MQKFATPAPISAVLDIPAGRIRFIAADRVDTVVEVLPADASKGRDVKVAEQTTVEYGDGVLRTEAGEVSIDAAAGVSASLDAGTSHGRIHNALKNTDGADAALTIHATTAYGDITARSL